MRIGIVNDMSMALELLRRIVSDTAGYEVAWLARHGIEAIQKCHDDRPDLILMDLVMPGIDGAETTRRIMQQCPCAILVVTGSVKRNQSLAFDALSAGAIDVVKIPRLVPTESSDHQRFWKKIRNISHLIGTTRTSPTGGGKSGGGNNFDARKTIIAIGASTGGPRAVTGILSTLPQDLPAAVIVVMHVDQQFARGMAQWMNGFSKLPVRLVHEGEYPQSGSVLLAASNDHLVLTENGTLYYTSEPADYPYRPSVDAFFSSLEQHWQGEAVGVLLTGMGKDGARGLKVMREHGWWTITQDEKTSAIYGMPKAAAEIGAASTILALDKIGPELIRKVGQFESGENNGG